MQVYIQIRVGTDKTEREFFLEHPLAAENVSEVSNKAMKAAAQVFGVRIPDVKVEG